MAPEGGLPPNIKIAHFGAIEGLDEFKRVRLLISIGRAIPGPQDAEELAALLSGRWRDVTLTHYSVSGGAWFERQFGGVTMADGSCLGVEQDYHPDELVEAIRWQQHEAKVIQAVGRARAVNCEAGNPLSIDIVNNAPLPILVDEAVRWEAPSPIVEMFADGVALTSPLDIHAAWPDIFESERTAKRVVAELPERPSPPSGPEPASTGWAKAVYQWGGPKQKMRTAYFLPCAVPDIRSWLTDRAAGDRTLKAVSA